MSKIKLVIEIDSRYYNFIKNKVAELNKDGSSVGLIGWSEIANGKPYESKYIMKEGEK